MANPVLENQFGSVSAGADAALQTAAPPIVADADRMTMGSVLTSTGTLLILVMAGAAWGWANAVLVQRWYWLFFIVLIGLVILTVTRPQFAIFTGAVYSLGQGAFVGSISKVYETFYDGIVFQAVLATFAVFVAMLFLYATRIVKVTQKVRSVIIIATVGIGLFYLFSFILSLFGAGIPVLGGAGTGALIFSAVVVIVASLNLLLDFEVIERGIRAGAPKVFSWFAAFGLMVTIVWLYIEILRLLAIIAARRQ
ncbi:MAG: Bax inhibitor-1/YccA family protein [Actinomycetota bacterium]|nr:Bax inhibitor-1/YccA family protein [Actinomycetota bacterium]